MTPYVLWFEEVDRSSVAVVGGKGAHLGALVRMEGVRVPAGFCVTTDAYRRFTTDVPSLAARLDELSRLERDDREAIDGLGSELRATLEAAPIPSGVEAAITEAYTRLGAVACAVRSSATAEDLPNGSFAGQHDTYLNVVGLASLLSHIRRCWASLFTERAVAYRMKKGLDHRRVHMAVVVQRMVSPEAAGVVFTADPATGDRKVTCVEAGFGLGEALVSGLVNADVFKVRDEAIIQKTINRKRLAIRAAAGGGTRRDELEPTQQARPALADAQVLQLAQLGRRIEAHLGGPQDIEWCLAGDDLHVVQSRPITTLFPIPVAGDQANHVYISVGHQQMMTDAMRPLGLSFWQMTTPRPMAEAGGRLFVDVTQILASPATRVGLLDTVGQSDPLIRDALQTVLDRGDFIPLLSDHEPSGWAPPSAGPALLDPDPSIVARLVARCQASITALTQDIEAHSGAALLDFILADLPELKRVLFDPESRRAIMTGMEAAWWLNAKMAEWLGEQAPADTLSQSVPDNVTSEMGLALMDLADAVRPHPEVVTFLQDVDDDDFVDALPMLAGGREVRDAFLTWLDRYGMRGPGEIDITRPRFRERPAMLLPMVVGYLRSFAPGEANRRVRQGRQKARELELRLLERLRALPGGEQKAAETKRMIDRVRTFAGYREYPKYGMVSRYLIYKQALLREAERLVRAGVLREREDIYYLRFEELQEAVRTRTVDDQRISARKAEFQLQRDLTPPRVLTSDGECLTGAYRRSNVPTGALVGLPVSTGTVEGRARVVLDFARADLEAGDILVTRFTDPSWTPAFVAIKGLVTEVGGLMTHGAVIAREYGLPAVVGVEDATRLIGDGQRIRVNGTEGYVELLA
ncbi:MAG: phosphoenolpyruvate synthase [Deltaproteobacteria bacterium]|nr:phosphoenolpyruvate synthase [Deltaproteobacteria bacterium]